MREENRTSKQLGLWTVSVIAGLTMLAGCTAFVPQAAGDSDYNCQIICRFDDGTVQGGDEVSYQALYSLEAAQFACEAQVDENPGLLQENCPDGSTPSRCSCYEN